jgi:hypothetical protein
MPHGNWSRKKDIREAINDINAEMDRRFDRVFERSEASPYAIGVAQWLERVISEAEEKDPKIGELKQRVQDATDALDGPEGDSGSGASRSGRRHLGTH